MTAWTQGNVIANGIRVHYYLTGTGQKPAVVLLHGYSDNGLCWTRVACALQGDYDVVMLDARGHGLSEAPEGPYTPEAMVEDVLDTVDALSLRVPVLMGHSMGAIVAVAAASRRPERFAAVVLEDAVLRTPEEQEVQRQTFQARRVQSRERGSGGPLDLRELPHEALVAIGRQQHPHWAEEELGPWATAKQQLSLNLIMSPWDYTQPWQEQLPRITCPVLLMVPDVALGGMTSPAGAESAARLVERGEIVPMPGAGHNVRREQFDEYMRVLRAFLDRHARG